MVRVLESDFVGDLAYSLVRAGQQVLDAVDDGKVDVFDGGLACLFLDEVPEIVGGKVELVCAPCYRGQSEHFRLFRIEIAGYQFLETCEDIVVDSFTCSELAVIEAETVVQQDFYVGCYDAAAVRKPCILPLGISLIIAIGFTLRSVVNSHFDPHVMWMLALSALVACAWQFGIGKFVGRRCNDYISCGQGFGQKNTILAIWVSYTYLTPVISVAPSCYIVWQNIVNSWQLWRKGRAARA